MIKNNGSKNDSLLDSEKNRKGERIKSKLSSIDIVSQKDFSSINNDLSLSPAINTRIPQNFLSTPNSAPLGFSNFLVFSPVNDFREVREISNESSNQNFNDSDLLELLDKKENQIRQITDLLDEKEIEIKRLEKEKQEWLNEEENWKQKRKEQGILIKKHKKEIEQLEREIKEIDNDFLQVSEKNVKLSIFLSQEKAKNKELENNLSQKIEEFYLLDSDYKQIKERLKAKTEELFKLKKINDREKEDWKKLFTEKEENYEKEKKMQEKEFDQRMNNLRSFQLGPVSHSSLQKERFLHKKNASSLPTNRIDLSGENVHEEEKTKQSPSLFIELTKSKKNDFSDSGSNDNFHSVKNKRNSDSFLLVARASLEENNRIFEKNLVEMKDVMNGLTNEKLDEEKNNEELLRKIKWLEMKNQELESSWKNLNEERIEREFRERGYKEKIDELEYTIKEKEAKIDKIEQLAQSLNCYKEKEQDGIRSIFKIQEIFNELSENVEKLLKERNFFQTKYQDKNSVGIIYQEQTLEKVIREVKELKKSIIFISRQWEITTENLREIEEIEDYLKDKSLVEEDQNEKKITHSLEETRENLNNLKASIIQLYEKTSNYNHSKC